MEPDFSPFEKDIIKQAIAAEENSVKVDKLDANKSWDRIKPYIKNAVDAHEKSLGIAKETPPELQKSFAEKLGRISRGGGGGAGGAGADVPGLKIGTKKKLDYSKGGKVSKPKVSSASKRADGIAQRGKTKGRFV